MCLFNVTFFCCRFIIGQKSVGVKEMMKSYDVNIQVPHPNGKSDLILISGVPAKVEAAKVGLGIKVAELEAEKVKMEEEVSVRSRKKRVAECELPPAKRLSKASNNNYEARRHRVTFTGPISDEDKAMVEELGGCLTKDMAECSVLVADKLKRAGKLLCMAARGVPIVSNRWLGESRAARRFLEPWGFIIRDPAVEKKWGCRLEDTLKQAARNKLLAGDC